MSSPTLPLGGVGRPGWARGNRLKRATNTHWVISAALIRAIGDRSWERPILRLLGLAHSAQGRFGEAMVCLEQSLALGRASGDRHGEAYVLQSLGEVYGRQGRLEDAVSCLEQSLVLAATTGDRAVEAFALHTLGDIRREQGRLEEAFGCLRPSLAALRDLEFRSWEARALNSLGMLLAAEGDPAAAGQAWHSALTIFRELGMPEATEVAARLADRLDPDALRHAPAPLSGGAAEESVEHMQRRGLTGQRGYSP